MSTKLKTLSLITSVAAATLMQAGDLPDISFEKANWDLSKHVKLENGTMTFPGKSMRYMGAHCIVPVLGMKKQKQFYYQADIKLKDIVKGPKMFMLPKLKITYGTGKGKLAKYNIPPLTLSEWTTVTLPCPTKKIGEAKMLRFIIAMEGCAGTFMVKNPRLTFDKPKADETSPYPVPANTGAELTINTGKSIDFSNDLLGLNSHFVWSKRSYSSPEMQEIISYLGIPHLRFPAGTVANFYDWHTDGPDFPPSLGKKNPRGWIRNKKKTNWKFGFDAYAKLCRDLNMSSELTFNVMWGTPEDSAKRLVNREKNLKKISWIELGNENYFPTQNYGYAKNVKEYIEHTKKMTKALKSANPKIKVAVNMEPEFEPGSEYFAWSFALMKENYYDGVVIHPYVGSKSYMLDDIAKISFFNSYSTVSHIIDECKKKLNKPLVLSEWGILGDIESTDNFFSLMGRTGAFFAIIEGFQKGIVDEACYHVFFNGKDEHNSALFLVEKKTDKIFKTRRGVLYEMMLKAFKDSKLCDSKVQSAELEQGVPSVQAVATTKDSKIIIFALNRLPVESALKISINGKQFTGTAEIEAFTIKQGNRKRYDIKENPYTKSVADKVVKLAPYSISIVSINQ